MADLPKIATDELALAQVEQITQANEILWRTLGLVQGTALHIANQPAGGESNGDA